jgi:hypothetical protein
VSFAHRGSESVPGWDDLQQVLDELCSAGTGFEDTAARQLDDCESLRLELEDRCRHVGQQQIQLQQARDELDFKWQKLEELRRLAELGAQQVQDEARRLADWHAKAVAIQKGESAGELVALEGPPVVRSGSTVPANLENSAALAEAHAQITRLAATAAEVAELRREHTQARSEVIRLQHRLAAEKGRFAPNLKDQVDFLKKERQRLTQELDTVRQQMGELQLTERAAWLDEMRSLRQSLEEFAEGAKRQRSPRSQSNRAGPSSDGNASLDRLIEQFDQLQNQLHASLGNRPGAKSTS